MLCIVGKTSLIIRCKLDRQAIVHAWCLFRSFLSGCLLEKGLEHKLPNGQINSTFPSNGTAFHNVR